MVKNIDNIVGIIRRSVEDHKIGQGDYRRWLWQNQSGTRQLGSNPYGCADAANILYTIGEFPTDDGERKAFITNIQKFQDGTTGMFNEATHHPYHTTAHCTAALELFDKRPLHELKELKSFDDAEYMVNFLEELPWDSNPWDASHQGAGFFAAKMICEKPSTEWQNAYFEYLSSVCDEELGMSHMGKFGDAPKLDHHLNGWFHYMFNFNHCHRRFPNTNKFIDTLIMLYERKLLGATFGKMINFREIDWLFPINRATMQTGYRRGEVLELVRDFAVNYLGYLEELDYEKDDWFNDLHALFGSVCALSELQLALGGEEIQTTVPLKNPLDRRPFI